MNPTSLPEAGAVGPTDTETVSGVAPLVGETISQLLLEKGDIVTFTDPVALVICRGCAGAFTPLKVNCEGKALRVELPCAWAVSIQPSTAASTAIRRNRNL